jgi:hypothetical protein
VAGSSPYSAGLSAAAAGGRVVRPQRVERGEVETSKNYPEGFTFRVPVDEARPNCVGVFLSDYITVMGIKLGDEKSFFAYKISGRTSGRGKGLKLVPMSKLALSKMRSCCKDLIEAEGLDRTAYAMHSSKRGGTIEAMKAGLTDAQIQELGRWSSSTMVPRYAREDEDEDVRDGLASVIRI